jgi:hypothetical protein
VNCSCIAIACWARSTTPKTSCKRPCCEHGRNARPSRVRDRTGNTRQDLIVFLQERIQATQRPLVTKVLPALAAEGAGNPAFVEQFRQLQAPIRQMAFGLFERGIARGDLPTSLDYDLTLDLLLGPLVSRQLINVPRLDPALAPTIVDAVLYGVARK